MVRVEAVSGAKVHLHCTAQAVIDFGPGIVNHLREELILNFLPMRLAGQ